MLETDRLQDTTNLPIETIAPDDLSRGQLATIRDEWLQPLMVQLRHQSEAVGRLQAQVERLTHERDRLLAELDSVEVERGAATESSAGSVSIPEEFGFDRASLHRLITQLSTAEGAAVTGIAIALGLWIGVGLVAFAVAG